MKVRVLVDAKVEVDVSRGIGYYSRTPEGYAKQLEMLVSDFNDFVRDHRSMDWVSLSVVKEYQEQCSHCHSEWELDEEGVPACCEAAIKEYEVCLIEENKYES